MRWTEDMDAFMLRFVPGHTEREIADEFEQRFGTRITRSQVKNRKATLGIKSGTVGGRFEKGHVPANKGRTWDEMGLSDEAREAMRSKCFKKGNIPHNAVDKPIGYERVSKDGYIQVKVADRPSRPNRNDNFRMRHWIEWERANGRPVPTHTVIAFADGDRRNFDPDNLVAVPRALWAVIQNKHIPFHDRETLESAIDIASLKSAVSKARRRERDCGFCGRPFEPRHPNQRTCDECLDMGMRSPRSRRSKGR